MGVVKFVELKVYKPDWETKEMVECTLGFIPNPHREPGLRAGHYVTAEQVAQLEAQHVTQFENSVEDRKRERIAFEARIAQLQFALQQAQGGR